MLRFAYFTLSTSGSRKGLLLAIPLKEDPPMANMGAESIFRVREKSAISKPPPQTTIWGAVEMRPEKPAGFAFFTSSVIRAIYRTLGIGCASRYKRLNSTSIAQVLLIIAGN